MSRETARYTREGSSREGGSIVYDSDRAIHTHSDTAPTRGQHSAFDLVRIERFGHLDKDIAPETPMVERPSFKAMKEFAESLPEIRAQRAAAEFEDLGELPAIPEARPPLAFRSRRDGRHYASIPNLALALGSAQWCGFELAFDTFRDQVMLAPSGTDEWRALTDETITRLMQRLEDLAFLEIPRERIRHVLVMLAKERQFDSAIRWIELLTWDGVPRIDRFLPDYCCTEDSDYTRAVSSYLWTALAGRVLDAGCKADMVPILVGPQGSRKTSAVASLVPDAEHFTEISLEEQDADLARKIRGRLIGEISELRGLGSRDLEWIKSFITRTHENWVPKYMEFATTFPRRLVFVGTTNSEEFLTDDTGNRRFLPVRVLRTIDTDAIRRDRLQLWAEGAARWRDSGIAWRDAERLAPNVHARHMVSDSWEHDIERWLQNRSSGQFTTAEALAGALGLSAVQRTRAVEKRLTKVLHGIGYAQTVTKNRDRRSVRVWRRPDEDWLS